MENFILIPGKRVVALLLLLSSLNSQAQQTLQGKIVSSKGEVLPYTAILVKNSGKGFISNEEGAFIVNVRYTDTLLFRRIGFKPLSLAASALSSDHLVRMTEDTLQITEVTVQPDDQYLYTELMACRAALFEQPVHQARAYYLLDGETNGKPSELMECYYNGSYSCRKVNRLTFKNGRVALAPVSGQYFVSIDFSKAFAMNDLTVIDQRLPISPLQLSRQLLRKRYNLTLADYTGPAGEVMHIIFTPKSKPEKFYAGEIWINTQTHLPMKIILDIAKTDRHPLKAIHEGEGDITNTGIHFEKVFVVHRGQHLVKNTLLKYHYRFEPRVGPATAGRQAKVLDIKSTTLLHFYDHDELFIPPYFTYDEKLDDYRKIAALGYNEDFWTFNSSLFSSRSMQEKAKYFRNNGCMFNYENTLLHGKRHDILFETTTLPWAEYRRLSVKKGNVVADTVDNIRYKEQKDGRLYDLKAQIYLDVNVINGKPHWFSVTLFDTYQSFYFKPPSAHTNCFINIFFDLYEIARRDLEKQLAQCTDCSIRQIDSLYQRQKIKVDADAENFMQRTNRGLDLEEMAHWNALVRTELGIDNMEVWGLAKDH